MEHSFLGATFANDRETTKGYRDGVYIKDSLGVYITSLRGSSYEFRTQGSRGIRSTTGDLYICDQALRKGRLVKPETLEQAYTKATLNDNKQIPYGFCWRIYEDSIMKSVYHGGSAIGYRALFRRGIKTDNNTIIILSNATNAKSFAILNGINAILKY